MSTNPFVPSFAPNPFIAHAVPTPMAFAEEHPAEITETTEPSYALVQSGPPVSADEVESHIDAVEVTVRWGTQTLSVAHLDEGKSFWVGEGSDVALPEDVLGAPRAAIVLSKNGGTYVVVPSGAHATISTRDARGGHDVTESFVGPREIALAPSMMVTLEVGSLTFEIGTVRKGKVAPIGFMARLAGGATGFIGLSFIGHAAIVASLAMFMPKMGADDVDAMGREQILLMQKYLDASALNETERNLDQPASADEPTGGGSTGGEPHKGESGEAGTTRHVTTNGHMGFKGNERESQLSKAEEKAQAEIFGIIPMLAGAHDPNAPSTPWAQEFHGSDDKSAWGKLFGTSIDDAAGFGVGLSGTGEGGGGNGTGVGIDGVGSTVGGGGGGPGKWGYGKGDKDGWGNGHGPGTGGYKPHAPPQMKEGVTTTNGRIPAEVIQRIVRQNFGRFRLCYESGLRSNPSLQGRVVTRFVIDRSGAVSMAQDAGSDLPDRGVTQCVVRSFSSLSFPQPEGGVATVTYPILLTPGDG